MRRPSVAAAGFALVDGQAADPDGIVFVASGPDPLGRTLLACVEPGSSTPRGRELSAVALRTLRSSFAAHAGAPTEALLAAFAAANAAILAENRDFTRRRERRASIGATAIVLCGREVFVAQAAPSQAILVQDGRVYAFPDLASWGGAYSPDAIVPESLPLGLAEDAATQVYRSEAAVGDLIALCATNLGQRLGQEAGEGEALWPARILTADLEGSVDRLERLMARGGIATSFAVVAAVTSVGGRLSAPTRARRNAAGLREDDALARDLRPPLGVATRDAVIAAAERLPRRTPHLEDSAARRRAVAAPGAQSVQRYREPGGLPAEVRANLPRGPVVHVPARVLAVSLAVLMATGGAGAAVGFQRDRAARAHASLAQVDAALQDATENPLVATSMITQAEQALQTARDAGADATLIAQYDRAVSTARDTVWNVRRLRNVQQLGALPPSAAAGDVRLALNGDTLYIAAKNLYELDAGESRLLTLLAAGDRVGDQNVGAIRDVSVDGGQVVAGDGAARYLRDGQGVWQRESLAVDGVGGVSESLPIITWGDAAYGVSWEGDIVRFHETSAGSRAEVWAASTLNPDLLLARDLAIDGAIHVLLQDGRILTFSRGALAATVVPFVTPRLTAPHALAQAPLAGDVYLVDGDSVVGENQGRIVRVNANGDATQYLTPDDGHARTAMAHMQEAAIDELSGTVYWIADGVVWQGQLPPG